MKKFLKHRILTLLLINVSIFFAVFITFEILTRIFFPKLIPLGNETRQFWQFDPLLGWSHLPNAEGVQTVANTDIHIEVNSKGLRDEEYNYEKFNKTRILLLGDSYAWGFGVEKGKRLSELIESEYPNIEIINSAVAGYSTDQQLLFYLNEGYRYNPDYVLLLFVENDFLGNILSHIHWYNKPYYTIANDKLVLNDIPVPEQTFYQKFRKFLSGKSYLISFVLERITILNVHSYPKENFSFSESAIVTSKLLEKLSFECRKNNSELILIGVPMSDEKLNTLSSIAEINKIDYLSLEPFFRNEENYIIIDDGHWNDKGNKIAANAISRFLFHGKNPEVNSKSIGVNN